MPSSPSTDPDVFPDSESAGPDLESTAPRPWLLALGAVVVTVTWTLLPFLESLSGQFLNWDDTDVIVSNAHLRTSGWDLVRWAFTTFSMGHYQPLTWLSLAADGAVWNFDPRGFRLTNLLLHTGTAVLLLFTGRRVLLSSGLRSGFRPQQVDASSGENGSSGKSSEVDSPAVWLAALLGCLFWAIHPLRAESVAWITERRDVLCGFFLVAATLAYLRSLDAARRSAGRGWLGAAVVLYALSLLSKASAIAFPVALVCLDVAILRRVRWRSKVPFALLALPYFVVAPTAQSVSRASIPFELLSVVDRLWIAVHGVFFYLTRTVWPVGLSAVHELPYPLGTHDARFLWALVGLVGFAVVAALLLRRRPEAIRPVACTAVASLAFLGPVLGLFQSGPQLVAERYTYFAALPLSLLLTAALARFLTTGRRLKAVAALSLAILLALGAMTQRTANFWRTPEELWTRAVAVDPTCALCNAKLGHIRLSQGRVAEAEEHFEVGLAKLPIMADALWALVEIYRASGRVEEAMPLLGRLVQRYPQTEPSQQAAADAYWQLGRLASLAQHLSRLPPALADRPWARRYRLALAALGPRALTAAGAKPDEEDLDAVARLLAATDRCLAADALSADDSTGAPEWILRVHEACRSAG